MLRSVTSAVAALAVAAGAFVAAETSASADAGFFTACSSSPLAAFGPTPVIVAQSNPNFSPCVSDSKSVASAAVTVIPGLLGLGATKATAGVLQSHTFAGWYYGAYVVSASSDIASLTVTGPGLVIKASGIHSDATVSSWDGVVTSTANSWIASLYVNGVKVNVLKNTPITIPVGLRTAIYINDRLVSSGFAASTPLSVTFPDHRYGLSLGYSVAELGPGDGGCNCT